MQSYQFLEPYFIIHSNVVHVQHRGTKTEKISECVLGLLKIGEKKRVRCTVDQEKAYLSLEDDPYMLVENMYEFRPRKTSPSKPLLSK